MYALRTRLILAASLVLVVFLGVTGIALDQLFQDAARAQIQDRLQSRIYALLAAADLQDDTLVLPGSLPDPNYSVPGSGLYAQIDQNDQQPIWRSRSLLDIQINFPNTPVPGQAHFTQTHISANDSTEISEATTNTGLFTLSYRVRWELENAKTQDFILHVAESRVSFDARLTRYRRSLLLWLAGASLMLLAVQGVILAWGLKPIKLLSKELTEIEVGEREYLSDNQPRELQPLVRNLNHLIRIGLQQLERHRNALADLAHSLKTPLSVLQNSVENKDSREILSANVQDTVSRMNDSLSYQLRKAAAGGGSLLAAPTELHPLLVRLRNSLLKVYSEKNLDIEIRVDPSLAFRADSGDLMEILGNLLDNACKWAHHNISVQGVLETDAEYISLVIEVDDDGPGIPESARQHVLERGGRIDEQTPGHGLGLAIVRELALGHYAGALQVSDSTLGGARFSVTLREAQSVH